MKCLFDSERHPITCIHKPKVCLLWTRNYCLLAGGWHWRGCWQPCLQIMKPSDATHMLWVLGQHQALHQRDRAHCERTVTVESPKNPALNTTQSLADVHFPTLSKGGACWYPLIMTGYALAVSQALSEPLSDWILTRALKAILFRGITLHRCSRNPRHLNLIAMQRKQLSLHSSGAIFEVQGPWNLSIDHTAMSCRGQLKLSTV